VLHVGLCIFTSATKAEHARRSVMHALKLDAELGVRNNIRLCKIADWGTSLAQVVEELWFCCERREPISGG